MRAIAAEVARTLSLSLSLSLSESSARTKETASFLPRNINIASSTAIRGALRKLLHHTNVPDSDQCKREWKPVKRNGLGRSGAAMRQAKR
jgi:hypothetical protein